MNSIHIFKTGKKGRGEWVLDTETAVGLKSFQRVGKWMAREI